MSRRFSSALFVALPMVVIAAMTVACARAGDVPRGEAALLETGLLQVLPPDSVYLGVWELAWDPQALRALEPGDRVENFFRPPVGEVVGMVVLRAPGEADGPLRGRLLRNDGLGSGMTRGPGITLTLAGERMVGQFSLEGVRYRISAGAEGSHLYAIDESRLPPPAQPDTPPEGHDAPAAVGPESVRSRP